MVSSRSELFVSVCFFLFFFFTVYELKARIVSVHIPTAPVNEAWITNHQRHSLAPSTADEVESVLRNSHIMELFHEGDTCAG